MLFVYGSLRSDAPRKTAEAKRAVQVLETGAEREGRASIAGRLYAPSWFPGFVEGPGRVAGEVWRITGTGLLDKLDAYEGDAYVRERREAVLEDVGTVTTWVYRYVG